MKLLLVVLLALLVLPVHITVAQQPAASFSGVICGSALATDDFRQWAGGLQAGTEFPIDGERYLSFRTLYTKWNFGELQAMQATALLSWYVSQDLAFYTLMGADAWLDGDQHGADFLTGVGLSARLYTASGTEWMVPFSVDVFAETVFADVDHPTGNVLQANVGLKFARPIAR